jgi:polysaccharide pyruvyl transferase WcaK-like protein
MLRAALRDKAPRIVISARLHGALESIAAGFPAIHLSYESKGWGAFEDLGISEFVLNARSATAKQVWDRVETISMDPSAYWDRVDAVRDKLNIAERQLRRDLRDMAQAGTRA